MSKHIARTGFLLSVAFALVLAIACSSTQTAGQQADDAAITAAVKTKLATDVQLSTVTNIEVDTTDGVVTLAGKVQTADVKQRAGELAQNVDGVVRVTNNIEVSGA